MMLVLFFAFLTACANSKTKNIHDTFRSAKKAKAEKIANTASSKKNAENIRATAKLDATEPINKSNPYATANNDCPLPHDEERGGKEPVTGGLLSHPETLHQGKDPVVATHDRGIEARPAVVAQDAATPVVAEEAPIAPIEEPPLPPDTDPTHAEKMTPPAIAESTPASEAASGTPTSPVATKEVVKDTAPQQPAVTEATTQADPKTTVEATPAAVTPAAKVSSNDFAPIPIIGLWRRVYETVEAQTLTEYGVTVDRSAEKAPQAYLLHAELTADNLPASASTDLGTVYLRAIGYDPRDWVYMRVTPRGQVQGDFTLVQPAPPAPVMRVGYDSVFNETYTNVAFELPVVAAIRNSHEVFDVDIVTSRAIKSATMHFVAANFDKEGKRVALHEEHEKAVEKIKDGTIKPLYFKAPRLLEAWDIKDTVDAVIVSKLNFFDKAAADAKIEEERKQHEALLAAQKAAQEEADRKEAQAFKERLRAVIALIALAVAVWAVLSCRRYNRKHHKKGVKRWFKHMFLPRRVHMTNKHKLEFEQEKPPADPRESMSAEEIAALEEETRKNMKIGNASTLQPRKVDDIATLRTKDQSQQPAGTTDLNEAANQLEAPASLPQSMPAPSAPPVADEPSVPSSSGSQNPTGNILPPTTRLPVQPPVSDHPTPAGPPSTFKFAPVAPAPGLNTTKKVTLPPPRKTQPLTTTDGAAPATPPATPPVIPPPQPPNLLPPVKPQPPGACKAPVTPPVFVKVDGSPFMVLQVPDEKKIPVEQTRSRLARQDLPATPAGLQSIASSILGSPSVSAPFGSPASSAPSPSAA